jgi:hypothetical protein
MMRTNRRKYAPRAVNHANLEKSPIMFPRWKERVEIVNVGYAEQKLELLLIVVVSSSVAINLWR